MWIWTLDLDRQILTTPGRHFQASFRHQPLIGAEVKPSPWIEGVTDAIGFVAGAAGGYAIGLAIGCDVFSPGYELSSMVGIALVGIGGGTGLRMARAWRSSRRE